MSVEAGQIPFEVRGNLRYAELTNALKELGLAIIELTDDLMKEGFSDAGTLFRTTFADGKIGKLRQKLLLLTTASSSEYLDQWLDVMMAQTEIALEGVSGLIEFARKDKTKLLTEEYTARIEQANSGLKILYRLWGLPLPDDDNVPPQLTS